MSDQACKHSGFGSRRLAILITCFAISFIALGATVYPKSHRRLPGYAKSTDVKKQSVPESPGPGPHHAAGSLMVGDTSSTGGTQSVSHKQYEGRYFELIRPKAHGPLPLGALKRDAKLTARIIRGDGSNSAAMIPTVTNVILGKAKALEDELDVGVSPNLIAWMGPQGNWSLLCFAVEAGQRDSVKILVRHGAYVNPSQYGAPGAPFCAPLVLAASGAEDDVVRYLLAHGADVNQKSLSGNTALSDAVSAGNYYTVKLLLKHGRMCARYSAQAGDSPRDLRRASRLDMLLFGNCLSQKARRCRQCIERDGCRGLRMRAADSNSLLAKREFLSDRLPRFRRFEGASARFVVRAMAHLLEVSWPHESPAVCSATSSCPLRISAAGNPRSPRPRFPSGD